MEFCPKCGNELELRLCPGEENMIPFCTKCNEFRFPMFNVAICTALFNHDKTKLLMMKQYGRDKYSFLAGYVNKGEEAECALRREMMEEMKMQPDTSEFLYSAYFQKSNTLMLNFLTTVTDESLDGASPNEVDEVHWFNSYDEAYEAVIKGSLAERLLKTVKPFFYTK
ncbi:MAG: NUDIX domain-containing protein [Paludibacteraceae bacterium]|nr:NUDIX domain-containing protein [Paludibacteraceae bacterium]HOI26912.1 NUDIX domain-containing protein [Paludibacteraceae bacterium]HPH62893.1 NUDIX domain-containing protein [Paludibacteraceae bacterium]